MSFTSVYVQTKPEAAGFTEIFGVGLEQAEGQGRLVELQALRFLDIAHCQSVEFRIRNRYYQFIGKMLIGKNQRFFSKQLAQPVILKTDLNELIGIGPNLLRSFRQYILSNFCTKQRLW